MILCTPIICSTLITPPTLNCFHNVYYVTKSAHNAVFDNTKHRLRDRHHCPFSISCCICMYMYIYIYMSTIARANISQSFTIPRTSEFYSDLSIAATLPIQIVSRVYEPFSRGVVSPFLPSCSTLLSHTNLLCERGHRPDNREERADLNGRKGPFFPSRRSLSSRLQILHVDFPCLRNGSVEMALAYSSSTRRKGVRDRSFSITWKITETFHSNFIRERLPAFD